MAKIINVQAIPFVNTVSFVVSYGTLEKCITKLYRDEIPLTVLRFIMGAKNIEKFPNGITQYYN